MEIILTDLNRVDNDIFILLNTSNLLSLRLTHGKENDEAKNNHNDEPDNNQSDRPRGELDVALRLDLVDTDDTDGTTVSVFADCAEGILLAVGCTEVGAEEVRGETLSVSGPRHPEAAFVGVAGGVGAEVEARVRDATLVIIPHAKLRSRLSGSSSARSDGVEVGTRARLSSDHFRASKNKNCCYEKDELDHFCVLDQKSFFFFDF